MFPSSFPSCFLPVVLSLWAWSPAPVTAETRTCLPSASDYTWSLTTRCQIVLSRMNNIRELFNFKKLLQFNSPFWYRLMSFSLLPWIVISSMSLHARKQILLRPTCLHSQGSRLWPNGHILRPKFETVQIFTSSLTCATYGALQVTQTGFCLSRKCNLLNHTHSVSPHLSLKTQVWRQRAENTVLMKNGCTRLNGVTTRA